MSLIQVGGCCCCVDDEFSVGGFPFALAVVADLSAEQKTGPDGVCIFKPKIPIWVNFGKCWYILWSFGIFYSHMVYFMAV
jgi:hypothetical protein